MVEGGDVAAVEQRLNGLLIRPGRAAARVGPNRAAQVVCFVQGDVDAGRLRIASFVRGAPEEAQRLDVAATGKMPRLRNVVLDVGVQKVDRDFFRVVAEHLKVNIRVFAGCAAEHRAGQIGIERRKPLHPVDRDAAQPPQQRRLAVALEERLIFADFFFDLVVIRQPFAGNTALADYLPCRFTLGRCVVQTVFSDHPGSRDGDFLAHALRIEM